MVRVLAVWGELGSTADTRSELANKRCDARARDTR